ncbi:MAG: ABC transporter substrate-binding protein [Candidatus Niyogibacteria bacterium]|nr:ABC transporter substrate-binding protein [Candidatus Niyogibacteria bacterium]
MAEAKTLKIGFISGFESPYGIVVKNQFKGAQLAVAEFNAQGGILGMPVELVWKDDKMKVELATQVATEAIEKDKVDLLVGTLSAATATEVNRLAVAAGIPFISINQVSAITEAPNMGPYTFHEGFTPYITAQLVGKWGLEHVGKRWFCLVPDYQWGHESYAAYQSVLKKLGGEDLGVAKFPLGSKPEDFPKFFADIRKAKPDVLCVTSFGHDQINFIKAAHQAELKKDMSIILGISEISIADAVSLDEMVGMYWGVNFYWGLENSIPSAKKFVDAFRQKFDGDTPSGYAGYAYSATMEFLLAAQAQGKYPIDHDAFTRFLEGRSYDHYKGSQWWRPCDHQSFQNLYVLRFKGPEESKHKYDIGEILSTVEWGLDIERDCQTLGHADYLEGRIKKSR